MNVREAYDYLEIIGLNKPYATRRLEIDTHGGEYDETYFPAIINITIQKQ